MFQCHVSSIYLLTSRSMNVNTSIGEAYREALEAEPSAAVKKFTDLQSRISSASLFSKNDTLSDLPTSSLPLLAVEFHLATALLASPTHSSVDRQINVRRCRDLFHAYLRKLDEIDDLLDDELTRDYRQMLEADEMEAEGGSSSSRVDSSDGRVMSSMTPAQVREAKIVRFRVRKAQREELEKLKALKERRIRLGMVDHDELDGYDGDGIDRHLALAELRGHAADALDEIQCSKKELEMLEMAATLEKERGEMGRHKYGVGIRNGHACNAVAPLAPPPPPPPPPNSLLNKPMEVTRVTKDPVTGKLQLKREEIKSSVFRPGWNQPTMTLQQYGDMEIARAKEREARQKQAEADNLLKPKRYEQLAKDGMEDNADLVDASAKLDREWDDWKEANPKGSGNKMGDRGDRNF